MELILAGRIAFYFVTYIFCHCLFSGEHHRNNENMDYFYQLEVWKGNIGGALRVARQRDELSDWLVAMAPMGR